MVSRERELAVETMIRNSRFHKSLIDGVAQTIGMCRTHHMILMQIARSGSLSSQKTIAEHIGITPAAVTGALQKLEFDGYVARTAGKDSRYNEITITEKGREVAEASKKSFNDIDLSLFEDFSEEELKTYITLLDKIYDAMKRKKEGGLC